MKHSIFSSKILARLLLVVVVALGPSAMAQTSNVLYSSSRIPQTNAMNPAFFPSNNRVYIALPCANINLTSPLSYSDVVSYQPGDTVTTINMNKLLDSLSHNGNVRMDANIYAVGLGLNLGKTFFTVSSQAKVNFNLGLPSGVLEFLNEGNYAHRGVGNEMTLVDGNLLNVRAYSEYAVGFGHKFGRLTVGGRLKILDGYLDLSTTNTNLKLYTAEDLSSMRADLYYQLRVAGALQIDKTDDKFNIGLTSYVPNNWGYNFDLGVRYETGFLDFSASVLDIGPGIHWQENIYNLTPENGSSSFEFSGINMNSTIHNGQFDTATFANLKDSLLHAIQPELADGGSDYWTTIPTKLNASAMLHLSNALRVGAMFHGEFDHNIQSVSDATGSLQSTTFRQSTTILGNLNLRDWVEIMASISVVDDGNKVNWFNPGAGVNISLFRTFQVYAAVDYMSSMYLVDLKSLSFYMGLNLMLVNRKDK